MGKSPGKWIKTLLFGKKVPKSNLSKRREVMNPANEEEALISAKLSASDLTVDPSLTSQLVCGTGAGVDLNLEERATTKLLNDGVILPPGKQGGDAQTITNLGSPNDPERIRHEQAAIKAQAAFRGYLARRAFRALRGIIRLQALVRGHLVRRQAVATLCCVLGIVRFQALVRGQKVRRSVIGIKVHEKQSLGKRLVDKSSNSFDITSTRAENLSKNAFVCKLLAPSPTAIPLRLQYGPEEPNSSWEWLKCWTRSRFWESQSQREKIVCSNSQAKQGSFKKVDIEQDKPKRGIERLRKANVENGSTHSKSESEKFKRNPRKYSSHPVDSVQEHPQNEIEKDKRNLRKISDSTMEASARLEADTGKTKPKQRNASCSAAPEVSEKGISDYAEKTKKDVAMVESKQFDVETSLRQQAAAEPIDELHDHPALDVHHKVSNGKNEDIPGTDKGFGSKDDQISDENQKTSRRRVSLPAKQDYQENGLHNTRRVPSYMATTESAKAKLRLQGSLKLGHDEAENNGFTRRHSLPSSTNGKLSSLSPGAQKLIQASGKGGVRNDKSLLSSIDGKLIQAGWRR
ncbi:hypothetical protein L1049_007134 [Liquidambar formosana]|uniref:DUF4005 domain-containing protein n=1 Tax=Liquidambar formosana TaxID=63359 RepID=A0AAP0RGY2_LIQFO